MGWGGKGRNGDEWEDVGRTGEEGGGEKCQRMGWGGVRSAGRSGWSAEECIGELKNRDEGAGGGERR